MNVYIQKFEYKFFWLFAELLNNPPELKTKGPLPDSVGKIHGKSWVKNDKESVLRVLVKLDQSFRKMDFVLFYFFIQRGVLDA